MEYAGYRVLLKRLITAPSTYETMAAVADLNGPSVESEQIEVSHRADGVPANMWRRYVSGMKDGGEVTFTLIFDPDEPSHDPTLPGSLYAQAVAGDPETFQLDYPGQDTDRTTATFDAYVTNWETAAPLEEGLTADVTLKVSGAVTWAHVPGV
jgi:Lambda phage tail tube protein, TTP